MTTLTPQLNAPEEARHVLEPLLPDLAVKGVEFLEVLPCNRPGEPQFWLAFMFIRGRRHSVGTPDLRESALTDQLPELVRQLEAFLPPIESLDGAPLKSSAEGE